MIKMRSIVSLVIFAFVLLPTASIYGQSVIQIVGQVVDEESGLPLPSANILINNGNSDEKAGGTTTDADGYFIVGNLPVGNYSLTIRVMGFKPYKTENIEITQNSEKRDLGVIGLISQTLELSEATMVAERGELTLQADKKVYRVGKDAADAGASVSEVMQNIPSVDVDIEGNVSLRGSDNVRILIDGKPSSRIGLDPATALQQLPATMVEKIEVITNPSAKYDAEGVAGIINIVMSKERQKGLNGSINVNAGTPPGYGFSFNLNYRVNKFNFFVNEGIHYREHPGEGIDKQELFDEDPWAFQESERRFDRMGMRNHLRTGFEYFPNKQVTYTFSVFNHYGDNNNESEVSYKTFDADRNIISETTRKDPEDEISGWNGLDFAYKRSFDNNGHYLTFDAKYEGGDEIEESTIEETGYSYLSMQESSLFQDVKNEEDETKWLLQFDYHNPYSENGTLEFGLKSTNKEQNFKYTLTSYETDINSPSNIESNDLVYSESISAAYLTWADRLSAFTWQLGLRAEYSDIITEYKQTNYSNERDYFDLFPNVHFGYELTPANTVNASYTRRLTRPRHWYLMPFWSFTDNRNVRSGNPDLDPEYSDIFEVGYLRHFEKGSIGSAVYYRETEGVIQWVIATDDSVSTMHPENISERNSIGFELNGTYDIFKWWRLQGDLNLYQSTLKGEIDGEYKEVDSESWFARTTSRFFFSKIYQAQVSMRFRGKGKTLQGERKPMSMMDLGVTRQLMDGDATLTFSIRDLFDTRKREMEVWTDESYTWSEFQRRGRTFQVRFTYTFNQDKRERRQQQRSSNQNFNGDDDMMDGM